MNNLIEVSKTKELIVSKMAENLIGSEIIKLAWQINDKIAEGQEIFNLTIGDFDPDIFPIPAPFKEGIKKAYDNNETNYPPGEGVTDLRNAVSDYLRDIAGLDYGVDDIIITSGARPVIFSAYNSILDPGDTVIFPVPSWNNNHYTHLARCKAVTIDTKPENNFMPTAEEIEPFVKDASLLSLCSPLNPTGTVFTENELAKICDLIVSENNRRGDSQKPLYLLFDQIYWQLTFGDIKHFSPVLINPAMKNYTVFIDGISKVFCATGVRVGWGFGPRKVINKMKSIVSHMGAWAPKAEQIALAEYYSDYDLVDTFLENVKEGIFIRLQSFYEKFKDLKKDGFSVDAISPQASIFMTVKIDLIGKKLKDGTILDNSETVTDFLIEKAKLALVPFASFGSSANSVWYRVAVGTCTLDQIDVIMNNFRSALSELE
ncbi:MAG TPA: pyridoxal phosphate-dependent aminotransferase [Ignavibacteria bacterium]|nr:pyridoxal phosphate-dependent aminotransferase [Ignavibacteria bacterium]HRJ99337.1 pyridoxal phosphate-dependent aminotransferase [Ignavibacteria bacterium]